MVPQLVGELDVAPARVTTIPDPALRDDEIAADPIPPPSLEGGRRFLAVSRLNRQKNLPLLLEAFARIRQTGDRLTIAGEGPERARIERRIGELGLADSVSLHGHVADVRPLLDAAHALVLSSDYEGVPAAVTEALARGRPVAATNCCASMAWLLDKERFGRLAPPGDSSALGRAMNDVAPMAPDRDAMRAFAAAFTLGKAAPAYLAAMQPLVEAGLHRPASGGNRGDRIAPC
jgi:glycosyltransferase involved in cell wall biosynthesis